LLGRSAETHLTPHNFTAATGEESVKTFGFENFSDFRICVKGLLICN